MISQTHYDDRQQSNFIYLLMKMIEIQSFQLKAATDFFIISKGYLTIDNALSKYIVASNKLLSEFVETSMIINQDRLSVDQIYTIISTYSNEYYHNLSPLESLSNEYISSQIKIEANFSQLYFDMALHESISYNLPEEIYQLRKALQPKVSAQVQKETRLSRNQQKDKK